MRDTIISNLYSDKDVNKVINQMEPAHLREDLKQEVFLALCTSDPQKIIELNQKNQLRYYVVRIILRTMHSSDNSFYYKYRRYFSELPPNIEDRPDEQFNEIEFANTMRLISANMNNLTEYEKNIFNMYMECDMNTYEVSREILRVVKVTTISPQAIWHTVRKTKNKLRQCN